jgi:hypothetical protein
MPGLEPGIHDFPAAQRKNPWMPAFAGMTIDV